jgi:hypothetical protein
MMAVGWQYKTCRQDFRWMGVFVVCVLCFVVQVARADVDDSRLLAAIAERENAQGRIGRAGELGDYQLHPLTIQDRGGWGNDHARSHLRWLKAGLLRAGVDLLPFNLALAWNAGLTRVLQGRALERHYAYACAVVALYQLPAGRSAASQLGVGDLPVGMSLAGITFVPVLHAPSGASLTEHDTIDALCIGEGVSPSVPGVLGLQTDVKPGVIPYVVTGAVKCRTGWPCRDTGHLSPFVTTTAGDVDGCPRPAGVSGRRNQFRTVAAMPRWQRRPLVEATVATLS